MKNTVKNTIKSRKIGFIIANGADAAAISDLKTALEGQGAKVEIIAPSLAPVKATDGSALIPEHSLSSTLSVCFDALYIASGKDSTVELMLPENKNLVLEFINEAYKHCKAIYFGTDTEAIYNSSNVGMKVHEDPAIITWEDKANAEDKFIDAIANHRVWELESERSPQAKS